MLKTYDPQPTSPAGTVTAVDRHGKFIDIDVDGVHLVFHLSRAGWLRWYDAVPRRCRGRARARSRSGCGSTATAEPGFDLTEAGTQKRLAVYLVRSPEEVRGIATLGPDPLAETSAGTTWRRSWPAPGSR